MWLQAPEEVENALWEGPLELATDETIERVMSSPRPGFR